MAIDSPFENTPQRDGLHALLFLSTATHLLSQAEIDDLLNRAQTRNAEEKITGVLLYNDGSFLQYLEGPVVGLSKIYEIIKSDHLHSGIIELIYEPISMREFPEWPMAFCSGNTVKLPEPTQFTERLSHLLEPSDLSMSRTRMLITRLWSRKF